MNRFAALFAAILTAGSLSMLAQSPLTLTVDTATPIAPVSPTLYGLMTEEINHAYDGGLYAEMVRNRTFDRSWSGFDDWNVDEEGSGRAQASPSSDGPSTALPRSLKLTIAAASAGNEAGLANAGWWGMAARPSTTYHGSFYAKAQGVEQVHVRLIADDTGGILAEARVPLQEGNWQQYTYTMKTGADFLPSRTNHLVLSFDRPGAVNLQLVSLFPPTYHGTPNGNRPDLMEMMAAMKPHFLRLPGGNYLEGDTVQERFNWKQTIGPLLDRPTHRGPWGYQSTDGMGLLEYLEWCEDLHMEPVLAVYAGYSLKGEHVAGAALEPFIQDDVDEIEYVIGEAATKWGAVRARDGHPAPFPLHYVEIGNEDWFDKSGSYDERFARIAAAIRARFPQLKLIATTPVSQGNPDVIDDHYYKSPQEFFAMVHHYDNASRSGPKVFVGEWATRIGSPTPNFAGALGDAAWMTGMERNSDLIVMASYAPLLTNVNPGGMQWAPDLIGYDALRAYGSPSYWAQVLFANHLGDHVVKTSASREPGLLFWSATVSRSRGMLYLKLVNASGKAQPLKLALEGVKSGLAEVETLRAATSYATNSIDHPGLIRPVHTTANVTAGSWTHVLPGYTIEVLDIPLR